jgi:hypothetical protein
VVKMSWSMAWRCGMPAAPRQPTVAESGIGYPNDPKCATLINTRI